MTTIAKFPAILAATALLAAPALAADWTGFYVGGQIGNADIGGDNLASGLGGSDTAFGIHAGYNHDFGDWVIGGEVDYDWMDIDLDVFGTPIGESVDSVWRAKLRGGYDFGSVLLYGTIGTAEVDTTLGSDSGYAYGLGLSYKATPQLIISGEYLKHKFDDFNGVSGFDVEADSVSLRASWQF